MKENERRFLKKLARVAIPVTLQTLLQNSVLSLVDQIMIGRLGMESVAAIGIAAKFTSIFQILVAATASVAGIIIAQHMGNDYEDNRNDKGISRAVSVSGLVMAAVVLCFTVLSLSFPGQLMNLYTKDAGTVAIAARYLRTVTGSFLPLAGTALLAALFRCMERTRIPLYAGLLGGLVNVGLNYILIFGHLGAPAMGAAGAALATVISQNLSCLIALVICVRILRREGWQLKLDLALDRAEWREYALILVPVLGNSFLWSLGENVFTSIYGHMGVAACAAMTLTNPIQNIMTSMLTGLAQAAGVLVGKYLGTRKYEKAYRRSRRMLIYGFFCAVALAVVIVLTRQFYVDLFHVEQEVRELARKLLVVYAIMAPVKTQNMILSTGIIRSGGNTRYALVIDLIGNWGVGVPLGLLSAFVWQLPVTYVYFLISLEECVRYAIMLLAVFRRKRWMHSLSEDPAEKK